MRNSKRETITQAEYMQVVGLLALADHHNDMLKSIERAALNILQELDHDGELIDVWGGGHVGDAIGGSRDAPELIKLLGLTIEEAPQDG